MKPLRTFPRLRAVLAALALAMSAPSSSAADAGSLHVHELPGGRLVATGTGHLRPTTAVSVSADGAFALTASLTPELRMWALPSGEEVRASSQAGLAGYVGAGVGLRFADGTNRVVVARSQAGVLVWDLRDRTAPVRFASPFQKTVATTVTSDGSRVVGVSGAVAAVVLWNAQTGAAEGVYTERWTLGYRLASLALDAKPRSWWESKSGEAWPEAKRVPAENVEGLGDMAIPAPDGRMLLTHGPSITARQARWVHAWDIPSGRLLWQHAGIAVPMGSGWGARWRAMRSRSRTTRSGSPPGCRTGPSSCARRRTAAC